MAVWSRFGWRWVVEYRSQRCEEVRKRRGHKGEYIFHDGLTVLPSVLDIHEQIAKRHRVIDKVTVEILNHVRIGMLRKESEPRYSAKQVFDYLGQSINQVRERFGVHAEDGESRNTGNSDSAFEQEERPKTPPSVPPGYVGHSGASSKDSARLYIGTPHSARPNSMDSATSDSPTGHRRLSNQGSFNEGGLPLRNSKQPTHPHPSSSKRHQATPLSGAANHRHPVSKDQRSQQISQRPYVSLTEGLLWKENKKRGQLSVLNGQENLTYLNERDHVCPEQSRS